MKNFIIIYLQIFLSMKFSIYNSLIDVSQNTVLLFNSFTDNFYFLKKTIKTEIKNPEQVKRKNLNLYRRLICGGVYVEERLDEFERLKHYSDKVLSDEDSFFLIINPTMNCNLKCWYCYENHLKSSMSQEVYNQVTLLIGDIMKKGISTFTLGFFGGEPLMKYKNIVRPLIEYTYNLSHEYGVKIQVTFTTNGTLLNDKMIAGLCKYVKPSFQVTLDGEESVHDKIRFLNNKKGTYSIILQNVKKLLDKGCRVTLRVNYTQESIESIWNIIDSLKTLYDDNQHLLTIDFHRVWQDKEGRGVHHSVKLLADKLAEYGFNIRYNELDEIKNPCYGDKMNTAIVNYNGDVFKCTAKDFIRENREGILGDVGNIVWEKSQEYRLSLKLKNRLCRECRIAPLCGGGCSRYILDKEHMGEFSYCVFNQNNAEIDNFIIEHVEKLIRNSKK